MKMQKVVKNSAEVTHEAINGPSSHRWSIGGERRLKVQDLKATRGILTK